MASTKKRKPRFRRPGQERFLAGLRRTSLARALGRLFSGGRGLGRPRTTGAAEGPDDALDGPPLGPVPTRIAERLRNSSETFLGSSRAPIGPPGRRGRGAGTPGRDELAGLAEGLDLTGLDSEDVPAAAPGAPGGLGGPQGLGTPRPGGSGGPEAAGGPGAPAGPGPAGPGEGGEDGAGHADPVEGGQPPASRPDGRGDRGDGGARPSRAAILAVFLAVVLVVLVWVGLSSLTPPGKEAAPEAPPEAPAPAAGPAAEPEVRLAPGVLAQDRDWRESLVEDVYEVQSGGTLSQALERLSLPQEQRRSLYQVLENRELLGQVRPGEVFRAWWATPERRPEDLERLEFQAVGAARPILFLPGGPDGFFVVDLGSEPKMIHQATQGVVADTFWEAGLEAGLEPWVMLRLVDLLASQVDFVSDIRTGDSFQILFLGEYQDGRLASRPIIEMIRFINQGQRHEFYRHVGRDGAEGFFDAQFRSIRKSFFKSPLQYSRVSSRFSRARPHPILKVVRPHLGVDYAAPEGTPVSAVADGTVTHADFRGGYGRLVVMEHAGEIVTMYGHLSSIAKGIRKGARVSQGDLIGNVGSSGLATGPHLDFRIRRKGQFVDPEVVLAEQQGLPMPQDERMGFADDVTRDQDLLKQLLDGS